MPNFVRRTGAGSWLCLAGSSATWPNFAFSCFAVREVSAGKFAHHVRMHDNFMAAETLAELRQVVSKVVNPDRSVGKNHVAAEARLLGTD